MVVHSCIGTITSSRPADLLTWANGWFQLALNAENSGNQLIVFEVAGSGAVMAGLNGKSQIYSQPIEGVDAMLFDPSFLQLL